MDPAAAARLRHRAPAALLVTAGVSVVGELAAREVVAFPWGGSPEAMVLTLGLALGAAFVGFVGWLRGGRAGLWPATLAAPLAVEALALGAFGDPEMPGVLARQLATAASSLLWCGTGGALISAAWLGVPPRRLLAFAATVGLAGQLVLFGWQLLLPGLALSVAFALFDVVAAEDPPGFLPARALAAAMARPRAFAVAVGATVLSAVVGFGLPFAFGVEEAMAAVNDPARAALVPGLVSRLAQGLVNGVGMGLASVVVATPTPPRGSAAPGPDASVWRPPGG